jgi:lipopolysaccharide export system protein LptA
MKKLFLLAALVIPVQASWAEKADSLKKAIILGDEVDADDLNGTQTLTGNVSLTKGTMVLKAAKALVRKDVDGNLLVALTAAKGESATFRQKRDGGNDLWVEGQAQRIEYDGGKELVKLMSDAKIKKFEGGKVMSEIASEFISYDSRKEIALGRNDASGESKPGKSRVMMVIEPQLPKPAPAASAATTGKQ